MTDRRRARRLTWQLADDLFRLRCEIAPVWPTAEPAQRWLFRRMLYVLRYDWRSQVRKSSTQARRARRTLATKRQR